MAEKEVIKDSSGFDHIAALNKAGFAVRGVRTFSKKGMWHEFDLGSKPSEVKQQAALMGLLDKGAVETPAVHSEREFIEDATEEASARAERREREQRRLTEALHSVLNAVSPGRQAIEYKPLGSRRKEKSPARQVQPETDAEVRVAVRELFEAQTEHVQNISLFNRILDYRIEFALPAWLCSLSSSRTHRGNITRGSIISQLKEVYK